MVHWKRWTVLRSPPVGSANTFYKDPVWLCTWQSQLTLWEREKQDKGPLLCLWELFDIGTDHKYLLVTSATIFQWTKHIHGYVQERGSNDG